MVAFESTIGVKNEKKGHFQTPQLTQLTRFEVTDGKQKTNSWNS